MAFPPDVAARSPPHYLRFRWLAQRYAHNSRSRRRQRRRRRSRHTGRR